MKDILVGYSGFVGTNIAEKHSFEGLYNSKNIEQSYGTNPELLVYAGVPSAMFLANNFPEKDFEVIENAMKNIKMINPKIIVLISTIAIYDNPVDVDETAEINIAKLTTYGKNRLLLEQFVEKNYDNYLIVRLPALFGKGLKKNFIYDYINIVPALLTVAKFEELIAKNDLIKKFYKLQDNGFYKCKYVDNEEKNLLKEYFNSIGFSALNFTDSRSVYQFYDLSNLWNHIEKALKLGIKKLNLATEPISVQELYKELSDKDFQNKLNKTPFYYNYKTLYANQLCGTKGYIYSKKEVIRQIKDFIKTQHEGN